MQKVIAKIHLGNIRRNAERFISWTGNPLCAVVKANAYGHGAEEVVNALEGIVDCFAVALIEEAMAIRTAVCGKDILIFTPPMDEEQAVAIAENGFVATVPDLWTAQLLVHVCEKWRLPMRVHLKINTGMNRYGMNVFMLGKVCKLLQGNPYLSVVGIYSHLYEYTYERAQEQKQLFLQSVNVCRRYFPRVMTHLGGTYGALLGGDFCGECINMVRVGIGLYGYYPDDIADIHAATYAALPLEKGMTLYGQIVTNRHSSYGGMGYGAAWQKEDIQTLGRISIGRFGYADGFLRQQRNGMHGGENNANNLCMDVCLRTGVRKRGERIPILTDAAKTAQIAGTITHEVLCAATRRAEFVYDMD